MSQSDENRSAEPFAPEIDTSEDNSNKTERKALGRRLASFAGGRLVDRPHLRRHLDTRPGDRRRRGFNIDVPTGGIPGFRDPTGSDFDPDRDGWVDEGTTRPRFIGVPNQRTPITSTRRVASGRDEQQERKFPSDRTSKAKQRVDGLRAAVAELEKSGNWTGKDNNVILSANSGEFIDTLDIDAKGIVPRNQTKDEFIAAINETLDKEKVTDPIVRDKRINEAISTRLENAREKLLLAEESLKIQEWAASRKSVRESQNVVDIEDIPVEVRKILRKEAEQIRKLTNDEIDKLFISQNPSNAYFIHHGTPELDGGVFDPEKSRGGGLASSNVVGNTRMLNEMMSNRIKNEHIEHKSKESTFRSLLEKLRNDDANSVISDRGEAFALATIMSSPYQVIANAPRTTGGWEIGDSLKPSDLKIKRPTINIDGIIAEIEKRIEEHARGEERTRLLLAALGTGQNFMSTHAGIRAAASDSGWKGYLHRYQTESFRSLMDGISNFRLKSVTRNENERGTSWYGVGRWGIDVTSDLGPGDEWQVIGKNQPFFGLSKPVGFDSDEYSDILLAITPRAMRMHEENGYVDINDLIANIEEPNVTTRLSSGVEKPSYPRKPTYGAFIGGAEEEFGTSGSWEEFRDKYNDREIIFFDYETTGLVFDEFRKPSSNGRPTQFGAVKMKNGKVIDSINIFMNPNEPLGEWSLANLKDMDGNPLTDEWLRKQISIKDAHQKLVEFAGDDAIFGVQNASFDKDVLELALGESGISWRPKGYIDTKEIADMVLPKWSPETDDGPFVLDKDGNKKPSNGLAAITKYLNVDLGEKHHTADADAKATGLVMSAIIDGAVKNNWSSDVLDAEKRSIKLDANNKKFAQAIAKFESDVQNYRKLSSGSDGDYRGFHTAPDVDTGAPLHDMLATFPEDVYSKESVRYYGTGDDRLDKLAADLILKYRGKPEANVTIYRAVPLSRQKQIDRLEKQKAYILRYGKLPRGVSTNLTHSEYYEKISNDLDILRNQDEPDLLSINRGDWVTPIRDYAVEHGEAHLNGEYEILKKNVKAKHIFTNGDSWLEWGYDDSDRKSLSSGAVYESLVETRGNITKEQSDAIDEFENILSDDEFKKPDTSKTIKDTVFDYTYDVVDDSPERAAIKEKLGEQLIRVFDGEINLDKDIVVTAKNGDKINLGNKIKIATKINTIEVDVPSDEEISEMKRELDDISFMEKDTPFVKIEIGMKIQSADDSATKKLIDAGIPEHSDTEFNIIPDFELINDNTGVAIGRATRSFVINGNDMYAVHDSIDIGKNARGAGIGSAFNARNENLYKLLGASSILTMGQSNEYADRTGATHWARNGFTWAGEPSKQKFLEIIDNAITNNPGDFTEEELRRISGLYRKDPNSGKFITGATPEQLVDFANADAIFKKADVGIYFKRDIEQDRKLSRISKIFKNRSRSSRRERVITNSDSLVLSSGSDRQRPIIKLPQMRGRDKKVAKHQAQNYKYGDKSALGGEVRRTSSNWLRDMTNKQVATLLVPTSRDEFFQMWMDDYAPTARKYPDAIKRFRKAFDDYMKNNPWDEHDYSPETIATVREKVEKILDSNPKLKWAFSRLGAPIIVAQTEDASKAYEAIPSIKEKLDLVAATRANLSSKKPYVRARVVPFADSILFSRRLIIGNESHIDDKKPVSLLTELSKPVTARDAHINSSISGVLAHEYGHWLHFRAVREGELAGKSKNRTYYGSGNPLDKRYQKALQIAAEYNDVKTNAEMMASWSNGEDINASTDKPRVITSYGNTNPAEALAEGFSAVLHPNDSVAKNAINKKLRDDVYALLGIDEGREPWLTDSAKQQAANRPKQKFSSGAEVIDKPRVKYSDLEVVRKAMDTKIRYITEENKRKLASETLTKGFKGGFTVELDSLDDIKSGVAVARNRRGMTFIAKDDFTPDGEPSEELIDTFIAWLDFNGPEVFNTPSNGANQVAIGGWMSNGELYLDVTDIYPTDEYLDKAAELGSGERQKAVTHLDKLWELIEADNDDLSPAFIDSGGDGGETISRDTINAFRIALDSFISGDTDQERLPTKKPAKKLSSGMSEGQIIESAAIDFKNPELKNQSDNEQIRVFKINNNSNFLAVKDEFEKSEKNKLITSLQLGDDKTNPILKAFQSDMMQEASTLGLYLGIPSNRRDLPVSPHNDATYWQVRGKAERNLEILAELYDAAEKAVKNNGYTAYVEDKYQIKRKKMSAPSTLSEARLYFESQMRKIKYFDIPKAEDAEYRFESDRKAKIRRLEAKVRAIEIILNSSLSEQSINKTRSEWTADVNHKLIQNITKSSFFTPGYPPAHLFRHLVIEEFPGIASRGEPKQNTKDALWFANYLNENISIRNGESFTDSIKKALRVVNEHAQDVMKKNGVTTMKLYRGTSHSELNPLTHDKPDGVKTKWMMRGVSGWTSNLGIAKNYSGAQSYGGFPIDAYRLINEQANPRKGTKEYITLQNAKNSVILSADVPVKNILFPLMTDVEAEVYVTGPELSDVTAFEGVKSRFVRNMDKKRK